MIQVTGITQENLKQAFKYLKALVLLEDGWAKSCSNPLQANL